MRAMAQALLFLINIRIAADGTSDLAADETSANDVPGCAGSALKVVSDRPFRVHERTVPKTLSGEP